VERLFPQGTALMIFLTKAVISYCPQPPEQNRDVLF
jgi:hypothetical protein